MEEMRLLEGRVKLSRYRPSFLKDGEGRVIAVSFSMESFMALAEEIEDHAFLEGRESGRDGTVGHGDVLSGLGLTPARVREIRRSRGLTADQFGKRIGYSGGTVRNVEAGQNRITERFERAVRSELQQESAPAGRRLKK